MQTCFALLPRALLLSQNDMWFEDHRWLQSQSPQPSTLAVTVTTRDEVTGDACENLVSSCEPHQTSHTHRT